MSSEREHVRLRDIIENIDRITAYLSDAPPESFGEDQKTVDAVERCLQRITEAVIKIGEARMRAIAPSLPAHAVRGMGNVLRHDYDIIDPAIIWNTVTDRLPELRRDCVRALTRDA